MIGLAAGLGLGLGAINMIGSYMAAEEEEKRQKQLLALRKQAALMKYAAVNDATDIQKAMTLENTSNAIAELERVSSANTRGVKEKSLIAESSLAAKSEGLVSGISKGKEMLALQIKGQKAILANKSNEVGVLVKLLDDKDKAENELNQRKIDSYYSTQAVLSETFQGASAFTKVFGAVGSGIQGFNTGYQLGTAAKGQGSSGVAAKGGKG